MPARRFSSLRKYLPTALMLLCPFLMGAANPLLVSLLSLLFLTALTAEYLAHQTIPFPTPALPVLGIVLLSLFGVLPLPSTVVTLLSPHTAALQQESAELTGNTLQTLSISPLQSVVGIQHSLLLLYVFLLGGSALASTRWQRRLPRWLALAGGLLAVLVGLQFFAGSTAVYGVYPTSAALPAPFINMNHLAAFAALCLFCALGSLQHAKSWQPGAIWLSTVACLWLVFESQSRAGFASFLVGIGLFLFLRYQDVPLRKRLGLMAVAVVGLVLVSLLLLGDQLALSLETIQQDIKVQMWRDVLTLLPDVAVAGVGRSALSDIFSQYQSFAQPFMVRSAEQLFLGVWVELGLLGLSLLVWLLWTFRHVFTAKRDLLSTGVITALCVLLVHDLADFSLEIAGVAVPAAMLAGNLYRQQTASRPRFQMGRLALALFWLLSLTLCVGVFWAEQHSEENALQRVEEASQGHVTEIATQEIRLRPLYGYLYLATAERLLRDKEALTALPYLNRARLYLPQEPRAHLLAGRALFLLGRYQQARAEYRVALEAKLDLDWYLEATTLATSDTAMMQLSPHDRAARAMFREALASKQRLSPAIGVAWSLVLQEPRESKDWRRLAELCLASGRLEEALVASLQLERRSEQSGFLLHAQVAEKQQDDIMARQILQEAIQKWPQDGNLWLSYASALNTNRQEESALLAARKARSLGASAEASFLLEGSILEKQQRLESAKQLYLSALEMLPRAEGLRISLARVYEQQGQRKEALGIFRQLQRDNPKYQAEIDRLAQEK